jgi:hypothetical protein
MNVMMMIKMGSQKTHCARDKKISMGGGNSGGGSGGGGGGDSRGVVSTE